MYTESRHKYMIPQQIQYKPKIKMQIEKNSQI